MEIAEIQTVVEQTLIAAEKYNWAEAYTEYRLKRDLAPKQKQDVNYNVSRLVNRDESVVNENANKDSRVFQPSGI